MSVGDRRFQGVIVRCGQIGAPLGTDVFRQRVLEQRFLQLPGEADQVVGVGVQRAPDLGEESADRFRFPVAPANLRGETHPIEAEPAHRAE